MEMEDKGMMRALVVMVVVVGMLATTATSQSQTFSGCYLPCINSCISTGQSNILLCSWNCLLHCIPTSPGDPHSYCNLGCAYSMCSKLSTEQNPAAEEVEGCVNNCSQTCSQN
uniref:Thionin-like protein 2 n=1 Tax=Nelumbo nucifera TaxID=4432 RepID=A0A822ZJN6_NELNU|nr:TPA_asm: hypothetical protein HUJ06_002970 [Nelumbo nucifera]